MLRPPLRPVRNSSLILFGLLSFFVLVFLFVFVCPLRCLFLPLFASFWRRFLFVQLGMTYSGWRSLPSTPASSACLLSRGPLNCHGIVFSGVFVCSFNIPLPVSACFFSRGPLNCRGVISEGVPFFQSFTAGSGCPPSRGPQTVSDSVLSGTFCFWVFVFVSTSITLSACLTFVKAAEPWCHRVLKRASILKP